MMKIKKTIKNPYVLKKKLISTFGNDFTFITSVSSDENAGFIEFKNLPDIIDQQLLQSYIQDWAETKTDDEEIAEEQELSEEKKLFLKIAKAFKPSALEQILKPEALQKLQELAANE